MTIPTPFCFQDRHRYPQDNYIDFEYWLAQNPPVVKGWEYLPITWTAYYKANGYGARIQALQNYLNTLPPNVNYWTVCQYDDGILNDISGLNVRQYNMGSPGDYQLPLICQPHQYPQASKKDIFCSFVGRITNPIRQKIVEKLTGKDGYYISTKPHRLDEFCGILARSRYVLAPRGYGMTSFRICEALQYGARAVYISDQFLAPHGLTDGSIKYVDSDWSISEVMDTLMRGDTFDKDKNIATYHSYFTYEANRKLIIQDLKSII